MDKRTLIGIVLISVVFILWPYYMRWISGPPPASLSSHKDSTAVQIHEPKEAIKQAEISPLIKEPVAEANPTKGVKRMESAAIEKTIVVESPLIRTQISSRNGGMLENWELKKYAYYKGGNVDLISGENGLNLAFVDYQGKQVELTQFNLFVNNLVNTSIVLDEKNPKAEIEFYLPIENGKIVKKYIFYHDRYSVDVIIRLEELQKVIANRHYLLSWENGLMATEENVSEDYDYAKAYAYMGQELEDLEVSDNEAVKETYTGRVDWSGIRTKYFLAALIPFAPQNVNAVTLHGNGVKQERFLERRYSSALEIPYLQSNMQTDSFSVFLGPLDHEVVAEYDIGLDALILNKGWYENIFRFIGLMILPAFKFLYKYIPNYGFVIIIFSILVKIILHPLTKKSYESMGNMQAVQPELQKLREKHKNDPQRMNREMMRLYKDNGINPLGGCLPMLLQMPLLFALFSVFRSTIQLRGEPFIAWITDLSLPDQLHLGFEIPFLGESISVLPFLMGITMIWQSRMTMTDPKQSAMVYIMPVFITFLFYSLPSGLNLYYAVFNVLSMFQTRMIKKKKKPIVISDNGNTDNKQKNFRKSRDPQKKFTPRQSRQGSKTSGGDNTRKSSTSSSSSANKNKRRKKPYPNRRNKP